MTEAFTEVKAPDAGAAFFAGTTAPAHDQYITGAPYVGAPPQLEARAVGIENWLTVKEAARATGYHEQHLRKLIRDGEITARRAGITYLIDMESLRAYMAASEKRGPHEEK